MTEPRDTPGPARYLLRVVLLGIALGVVLFFVQLAIAILRA